MKEQKKIPSSKVKRASKFVRTGFKVGGNYIRHYSKKAVNPDHDRTELDEKNAEEIYGTLSELKGSALKVAQMLSMDEGILPKAFSDKFSQAQYQAPALSGPLVMKTVRQYLGESPSKFFDSFQMKASYAASIGQVHRGQKDGHDLAIKIQYPGVADSVVSDLKLVRPIAKRMLNLQDADLDIYFEEVKERLLEEADYELELNNSISLSEKCEELEDVYFPRYFPQWSGRRVITMEWMDGKHLDAFLAENPSQEVRNRAGQALWDFYNFQIHRLQKTHADAHPGNFLFQEDGRICALDFGCVKVIPEDFYHVYRAMLQPETLTDDAYFEEQSLKAGIIYPDDTSEEKKYFLDLTRDSLAIVCKPFYEGSFDFSDQDHFNEVYTYGEKMFRDPNLRKMDKARGSQHAIYLNRTYFGLFMILHKLGAKVNTRRYL